MTIAVRQNDQIAGREFDRRVVVCFKKTAPFDDDVERRPSDNALVDPPWRAQLAHAEHGALKPQVAQDITEKIHIGTIG